MIHTPCAVDLTYSHGHIKHSSAETIRTRLLQSPPVLVWINRSTNRLARVCQLSGGLYAIQIIQVIDGKEHEITCFVKSKMNRIEQVEKYLQNTGYGPE